MSTATFPRTPSVIDDFHAEAERAQPYLDDLPVPPTRSPLFPSVVLPRNYRARRILVPLFWAELGLLLGTVLVLASR
jgi:hypothetical protein